MIELHLAARLAPLVDGRLFPGVAPEGTAKPYLVYTIVSQPLSFTLSGPDGDGDANVQVTCWSDDHVEALQTAQALLEEVTRSGAEGFGCGGAQRLPDEYAAGLYGIGREFTLTPLE
ncbi:DUF3168 domain-containing protein [Pseudomonas putida]|uniref:tail completion protein gp17 n=1 Tax=Pseudomonas putida TaxID=303 RepID=UPI00370B9E07